jgi:hypothetical protein
LRDRVTEEADVVVVGAGPGGSAADGVSFVLKLPANLTDPRDGDAKDRIINGLSKVAPAV